MSIPWLIVAGDFVRTGGMDRANFHLAWHLADHCDRSVVLVSHRVDPVLANHRRVTVRRVPRPMGSHLLGGLFLGRAGCRAAAALRAVSPEARIIVNGTNCILPEINWVHFVVCRDRCNETGAPGWFRLKNQVANRRNLRREVRALRCSRLVIANSDATKRHVIEDVQVEASRVHRIHLGVDPQQYGFVNATEREEARRRFDLAGETPVLLFVGALGYDARKGFDTLLKALPRVRAMLDQRATLLAAGGGALPHWIKRVASMGLADSVRFLGHVDCVPALLAAADVFVSPVRYEPYGLNVHEAICRGVPAVVSRSAGVAERYPSELAGLLLNDPEDSEELARRLVSVLRDRQTYAPHVRRLGDEWLNYSWDDMAAAMVRLIEEHATQKSDELRFPENDRRLHQITR